MPKIFLIIKNIKIPDVVSNADEEIMLKAREKFLKSLMSLKKAKLSKIL